MARVLILAGDAAEELDTMYPLFRLREEGHEVVVSAPTTRAVKLVVHDFEPGCDAYTEKPGRQLPVDLAFADVRPEEFDALVIPGGRAPEYIRVDPDVARVVAHFFDHGLPVGTICHGPQVPAALGHLRGRSTAAYPPLKADMEQAGATYVDGPDVVDGAMVSCRGWPDLPQWSRAFVAVLAKSGVPVD
jgi:protease I